MCVFLFLFLFFKHTHTPQTPTRTALAQNVFCFFVFSLRVFFYDVDGDMDTRTLFDDFLIKEILAGRFDDFLTTNFLTIFLFEDLSGRRTSPYRRRPGFSSPSMPLLALLATRRRLGRRGDSSAMRSAFVK